jgi:hypothetical protein
MCLCLVGVAARNKSPFKRELRQARSRVPAKEIWEEKEKSRELLYSPRKGPLCYEPST